jgi:hypothetical protein
MYEKNNIIRNKLFDEVGNLNCVERDRPYILFVNEPEKIPVKRYAMCIAISDRKELVRFDFYYPHAIGGKRIDVETVFDKVPDEMKEYILLNMEYF